MSEPDPNLPPIARITMASRPPFPVVQPVPVQALPYTTPISYGSRPGILTAIGVIGIVIACLSTLSSLVTGFQSFGFYMLSKVSQTRSATTSSVVTATSGGSTVTTNVTVNSNGSTTVTSSTPAPTTQAAAGTNPLTPAEISGIVQRAQKASGNKLNAVQIAALTTALQNPNQGLVSPGTAWSPVRTVFMNPDGTATISLSGGFISIDPLGVPTVNSMNAGMPTFKISGTICALAALDAILSAGLAIYLFIASIIIMRNSPVARRLHLIYAVLKIPLAIAGGLAVATMYSQFIGGINTATRGAGGGAQTAIFTGMMVFCGVGLIYPIALLIALNSRGVRGFYNDAR